MYKPSDKLLGVWVTAPLLGKKNVIIRHETRLEAVVSAEYLQTTYEFHDSRTHILGHPTNTDYNGNGLHNLVKVVIAPVYIGWTRNAGRTFITDDDLIREKGTGSLGQIMKQIGYVPGQVVNKTPLT